jgi:hypothetical protein
MQDAGRWSWRLCMTNTEFLGGSRKTRRSARCVRRPNGTLLHRLTQLLGRRAGEEGHMMWFGVGGLCTVAGSSCRDAAVVPGFDWPDVGVVQVGILSSRQLMISKCMCIYIYVEIEFEHRGSGQIGGDFQQVYISYISRPWHNPIGYELSERFKSRANVNSNCCYF